MIPSTPLRNMDYHIAFTYPLRDPDHCDHCADLRRDQDAIHTHVRLLLEDYDAVDLTSPELRYHATVIEDEDGNLRTFDRYAQDATPEHFTDPVNAPAFAGRQYAKN